VSANFDPKKDAANLKKHGVSLAEGEQRFVTIGTNVFGALMVVVHTPRSGEPRIISVRKPDPKERRNYEKGV
jgi:uncharacterized DUF497 family protein